jgi:PAS domain S-box-containing protein
MWQSFAGFLKRPLVRYLAGIVAVGLAFLLREALSLLVGPDFPEYLVFYPTVMIVALLAGFWPALCAVAAAAATIAGYWIFPWQGEFSAPRISNFVGLGLFVVVCAFLSVVAELYRRSRQKAAAYDKEQALRESQEALRRQAELLKLSFDAIIVWRTDGRIESWNRGAEEIYGFAESEATGRIVHELLDTADVTAKLDFEALMRVGGQWEGELRHRTKDGRDVIVSSRLQIGRGFDGGERVLEIDRDITDRIRAREELQSAHDELEEKVLQRTSDLQRANQMLRMVSACDQALVEISDELELMHVICQIIQDEGGYRLVWVGLADSADPRSIRYVASAGDHDGFLDSMRAGENVGVIGQGPIGSAIRSGLPVINDISLLPESEPWRDNALRRGFHSMASLPLMSAEKPAFGALVIYSDQLWGFEPKQINLLKELVDDLAFGLTSLRARAERDQAQQTLETKAAQLQILAGELVRTEQRERRRIAQLLHDQLQQLLAAALYGLVSLRPVEKTPKFQDDLTKISDLLRECIEMSRSLTSELSHPALSEPDLRAALEWLAAWMKEKHGLAVEVEAAQAVTVDAEETRIMLVQAVRELLFNVAKHAGVTRARVRLAVAADKRVQITVSDEGIGFDAAGILSTGSAASGIGLFSIRERLALAGGGMESESSPGTGSRFTVWVPSPPAAPPKDDAAPLAGKKTRRPRTISKTGPGAVNGPEVRHKKIRVVLVDDHAVVRNGLALQLKAQPDIEIAGEAADGKTAVRVVRRLRPDVVTMDVSMPGMGGVEAARVIHAEFPDVRIIGVSMFEEAKQAAAMRDAGAVSYLSKSASFDSLLDAIRAGAGKTRKRA